MSDKELTYQEIVTNLFDDDFAAKCPDIRNTDNYYCNHNDCDDEHNKCFVFSCPRVSEFDEWIDKEYPEHAIYRYKEDIEILKKENTELKQEIKELSQAIFDVVIAPNCNTCSDLMSNKCDNGIICMGRLKTGAFIDYSRLKLVKENTELKQQVDTAKNSMKKAYNYLSGAGLSLEAYEE